MIPSTRKDWIDAGARMILRKAVAKGIEEKTGIYRNWRHISDVPESEMAWDELRTAGLREALTWAIRANERADHYTPLMLEQARAVESAIWARS